MILPVGQKRRKKNQNSNTNANEKVVLRLAIDFSRCRLSPVETMFFCHFPLRLLAVWGDCKVNRIVHGVFLPLMLELQSRISKGGSPINRPQFISRSHVKDSE